MWVLFQEQEPALSSGAFRVVGRLASSITRPFRRRLAGPLPWYEVKPLVPAVSGNCMNTPGNASELPLVTVGGGCTCVHHVALLSLPPHLHHEYKLIAGCQAVISYMHCACVIMSTVLCKHHQS